MVEELYAFNFSCSINFSRAALFSLLSFHTGELIICFETLFFNVAGIVAATCFLFSRYFFSAVLSNSDLPSSALHICLYETGFNGTYQHLLVWLHLTEGNLRTIRFNEASFLKLIPMLSCPRCCKGFRKIVSIFKFTNGSVNFNAGRQAVNCPNLSHFNFIYKHPRLLAGTGFAFGNLHYRFYYNLYITCRNGWKANSKCSFTGHW